MSTCPAGHTSESGDYCDVCGAPIGPSASMSSGQGTPSGPGAPTTADGAAGAGGAAAVGDAVSVGSGAAAGSGSMLDLGPSGAQATGPTCPNCGAGSVPGALFCEGCGYDFTTGQMPRSDPSPLLPPGGVPPSLPMDVGGAAAVLPGHQGSVEWVAEVWIDPDWHAAQEVSEPCPSPGMPEVIPLRGSGQLIGRRSVSRNIHPQIDCGADTGVSRRHAQLTTDGQRWWLEDLQSSNGTYVGVSGGELPDTPVPPGQRTELPDDARVYVGAWTRIVVRPATAEERIAAG